MGEQVPRFDFSGVSLERIHAWMQVGDGGDSAREAAEAARGLTEDLHQSQERLGQVLAELDVEWEGTAGDWAAGSTHTMQTWAQDAGPLVTETGTASGEYAGGFTETKSRMPTPDEALLNDREQAIARAVPGIGAIVSKHLADQKRDQVTQEARQRMHEWQDRAADAVAKAQPLPSVPKPVVQIDAPPMPRAAEIDDPDRTGSAAVTPSTPSAPAPPNTPGPGTPAPTPPSSPGGPPNVPAPVPPPPGGQLPPGTPGGPGAPGTPTPAPRPGTPVVVPPPAGGGTGRGSSSGGRPPGYGRGVFIRDEIANARGAQTGQPGQPGQPGRGGAPGGTNTGGAPRAGTGAASAAGARGGGGILQPAAGRGTGGDEDKEHKSKYRNVTDEPFTEGIPKVAPPVIGDRGQ